MFSEIPERSSIPQYPADPWNPTFAAMGGSPVAVCWAENLWFHAIAATSNDDQCEILLEDGSKASVPRASVAAIPNRPVFQAGHEVLARWRNPAMFPGTITSQSPQGYMVAWHDGNAPLAVPLGAVTFLEWSQLAQPAFSGSNSPAGPAELRPPVIPAPDIASGDWVAIRSRGRYWLATVELEARGGFVVVFTDGVRATVPDADVIPIPPEGIFEVGDQVLALWKAGSMFAGTITEESTEGYTVAWHDGDVPLAVPPGMITYLFWAVVGKS